MESSVNRGGRIKVLVDGVGVLMACVVRHLGIKKPRLHAEDEVGGISE